LTDLNVIAHAYNLAFISVFAVLELWLIQHLDELFAVISL